jgi:hypothetical protein
MLGCVSNCSEFGFDIDSLREFIRLSAVALRKLGEQPR